MKGSSQTPQILGTFGMYLYNICIFKFCVLFLIFEIIKFHKQLYRYFCLFCFYTFCLLQSEEASSLLCIHALPSL